MKRNSKYSWPGTPSVAILRLIPALLFAACVNDYFVPEDKTPEEALVTISLNVPAATRSLSSEDEDAARNIQVLAFDEHGKYAYSAHSTNASNNNTTFNIILRKGTWDLVVLANALSVLPGLQVGTPRDELLANLTKTVEAGKGWDAADLKITGIPMSSGLLTEKYIDENTTISNISLYRMVAKVDIVVIADNFTLESVRVYNYEKAGCVYPLLSEGEPAFALPRGESDKIKGYSTGELIYLKSRYPDTGSAGISDRYCNNLIYLNPAAAGGRYTLAENTCLVVGGKYATQGEVTYYRVDFSKSDGTYIDLIRNHQYIININKVHGSGQATENEAFDSPPVNMTVEVVDWSETEVVDVAVSGQFSLGVNWRDFVFYSDKVSGEASENRLTVSTTYTGEWEIASVSDWLTITRENDDTKEELYTRPGSSSTSIILSENFYLQLESNDIGHTRIGWIVVRAGKGLNQLVKVTQKATSSHTLIVSADSLNFDSNGGQLPIIVTSNTTWSAVSNEPWCTISSPGGTETESITVTTDPNEDEPRTAIITLTTTSGIPVQVKTVVVRQNGEAPSLNVFPASLSYTGGGNRQTLEISSNVSWSISSTEPSWCTISPASGTGNRVVTVTAQPNYTELTRTATITLIDTEGAQLTTTVTVTQTSYPEGGAADRITLQGSGPTATLEITNDPTDAGLYFKFGSVVGIYSGNHQNQILPDTNEDTFDDGDVAFNPSSTDSFTNWNYVPYANSTTTAAHTATNIRDGRGDPCRLVGFTAEAVKNAANSGTALDNREWCLPTPEKNQKFAGREFAVENFSVHWWGDSTSPFSRVIGGEFPSKNNGGPGKFLPAAGYRVQDDGHIRFQGTYGYYWSNENSNATESNYFGFFNSRIIPSGYTNSAFAFGIRCVRQ